MSAGKSHGDAPRPEHLPRPTRSYPISAWMSAAPTLLAGGLLRCSARSFDAAALATLTRRAEDIVWAGPYAECPLLAQSGHSTTEFRCPLLGVKRTCKVSGSMSAFDPKRTWAAESQRPLFRLKEDITLYVRISRTASLSCASF